MISGTLLQGWGEPVAERIASKDAPRTVAFSARQILIDTPLGDMVAVASESHLCLLEFSDRIRMEDQWKTLRRHGLESVVEGSNAILENTKREIAQYFSGTRTSFTVPLAYPGTAFQERVWEELARIPFGKTTTYAQLATTLGSKDLSRAVGRANGDNRIAIMIPCHRVIAADGHLCGYAGGLWRKQFLMALESGQPTLL